MSDTLAVEVGRYVYALVAADHPVRRGLTGLDGAPVRLVAHHGLAAAVADVALDRPPGRRRDLLAHDEVVAALAESGPVVPVRFGSVLPDDDDAVRELVEAEREHVTRALEHLAGARQYTVRATYREERVLAEVVQQDPEIRALHQRTRDLPAGQTHPDLVRLGEAVAVAMAGKRSEDSALLMDVVLPHVADHRERPGGGTDHLLTLSVLVHDDSRAAFEQALEDLAEGAHERIRLALVGPQAPYDFVDGGPWD
jgi:hypothetical protein